MESETLAPASDTTQQPKRDLLPLGGEQTIVELIRRQQEIRSHTEVSEPKPIGETIDRLMAKLDAAPVPSEQDLAMLRDERQREERSREFQRRQGCWGSLSSKLGRRYSDATLDSFQASPGQQQAALESVRRYVLDLPVNLRDGRGVLLFGPPGCGKDHLATAIMRAAVLDHGAKVEWADGADFYGGNRDNIDGGKSEAAHLARFRTPELLVLSDPVGPRSGVESSYQLSMLFRVIDRRYRDMKATVVTLNVSNREEAENRLSPNIIDRLSHGALVIHCNWKSYRTG